MAIQRALISVSDKTGLEEFAKGLHEFGVELISTGGTAAFLKGLGLPVIEISDYTGEPELFEGRLKTLHPMVHGGLLHRRDNEEHVRQAKENGIKPIDLVCVNLYPFEETVARPGVTLEEAIEKIDIGGPSMLRSAAKNYASVTVVSDPADYARILDEMQTHKGDTTLKTRENLAVKVFMRTTQVDAAEQHLDSVFWIDLLTPEPAEIKFVERLCGLEMPTYDEMREIEATSRLYTEDGARFMTTTVLSRVDTESPSLSEITFVLMGAKIITIRHSDSYSFRVFSHQLLRQKQISRDQVFTGLLETIVDRQADVLERFGAELDRLSKNIFRRDEPEGKSSKRVPVSSALRLTLQDLGRVGDLLTRQRDCLVNLLRLLTYASNEEALDDTNSTLYIKLRPLSRDVTSLSEYANFLSSNVNFMLDAVLGLINIEQNEIVKIFTVAAVVFMPPTLIASIYGMNFAHMPGLENEYGYYISLVVMLVSIILPLVYFRSRRLL
jgi:magnesium transporter